MAERARYVERLRELMHQHHVSIDEVGPNPGFIEDEMVTRQSYRLVRSEALRSGALTEQDLRDEGLPDELDQLH